MDEFIGDLESQSDDISRILREMNQEYGDAIDEYQEQLDRYQNAWDRRNQQDHHIGMKELQRHYNRDYASEEEAREAEKDIDILFHRAGGDKPFEDIGLPRADASNSDSFWTRRKLLAAGGIVAGGAALGWFSQREPTYAADTVQMESSEFQNVFDELPRSYQNDILPGGAIGNQYQAWFNEDDYEDLLSATLFYEEDPQKNSSMLYEHRLGDDETNTRRIIENQDAAERFYQEAIQ